MAWNWIAPLLAIWLALSGLVRYDAAVTASVRGKGPLVAGALAERWSCATAAIGHGRELARRAAVADPKQFLTSSTVALDRVPVNVMGSCPASKRTVACLQTLRDLHVKLQV